MDPRGDNYQSESIINIIFADANVKLFIDYCQK